MPLAVCATPIGNLADVTLRVLEELAAADTVLCEDTRHTRILLERHGIEARLLSYHQHNEATRLVDLIPRLEAGERIALVSDAGLPGVNDPGARLVAAAIAAGVAVTVLPGPSAVETALVASGLAGEQYRFVGYLPRSEKERAALWQELLAVAPSDGRVRIAEAVARNSGEPCGGGSRPAVAVCRELTKLYEEVVCDRAAILAERFHVAPKGEVTLVIGPSTRPAADEDAAVAAVVELVAAGAQRRVAAGVVARLTGGSRNALYGRSL